ncbi:MAG: DUF433 domain-containing protein [Planctomycetes bacterium]|nr:DUF433 domain-containing protein [Planctomycetota bacterium]
MKKFQLVPKLRLWKLSEGMTTEDLLMAYPHLTKEDILTALPYSAVKNSLQRNILTDENID